MENPFVILLIVLGAALFALVATSIATIGDRPANSKKPSNNYKSKTDSTPKPEKKKIEDYTESDIMDGYYELYDKAQDMLDGVDLYSGISYLEESLEFLDQFSERDWVSWGVESISELISLYTRTKDYEKAIALGERYQQTCETLNRDEYKEALEKYPDKSKEIKAAYKDLKSLNLGSGEEDVMVFLDPYEFESKIDRAFSKLEGDI